MTIAKPQRSCLYVCLCLLAATSGASASSDVSEDADASSDHWPSFRGPAAQGLAEGNPPLTWNVDDNTNIRWRVNVPGMAHSSPVIWGDRLFVTTAIRQQGEAELASLYGSEGYGAGESVDEEGTHIFRLYCFDKNTGDILWQRDAHTGVPKAKRHPKSTHANPTPACDSKRIVAFFASEGLYCFDHDGQLQWSRDFGILNSGVPGYPDKSGFQWGFASSPVLHNGNVIVQCDVENESFLTLLDGNSGEDIWRVAREEDSTWCTPTVCTTSADHRPQIVVNGYKHIGGYDLGSGAAIWTLEAGGDVPVPTPIVAHDLIYITNAHGRLRPIYAVKTTARGKVSMDAEQSPDLAWCHPRQGVYMQTPIVVGDYLYCCADGGILACYDARTGERKYKQRLGSGRSGFSGSPVAIGNIIYFTGENGDVHVIRAGPKFERIGVNEMGETCMSTPAVSDGVLYIRTRHHLVAVAAQPESK